MQKLFLLSTAATVLAIGCPSANAEMFRMTCTPTDSVPYTVAYDSEAAVSYITGSRTGATREYPVFDVKDKSKVHVLYVATKALNQTRTIYLAFDYSGVGDDVSAIRVIDGTSDTKDKCAFIPNQIAAKAALQQGDENALREQRSIADAERLAQENLRLQGELAKQQTGAADIQAQKSPDYVAKKEVEAKAAEAKPSPDSLPVVVALLIFTVVLLIFNGYMLPTIVAFRRSHPNRWIICAVNLFAGVTVLGWVLCLIWALHRVHLKSNPSGTDGGESGLNVYGNDTKWVRVISQENAPSRSGRSLAAELQELAELRKQGLLSDQEFSSAKQKLGLLNLNSTG